MGNSLPVTSLASSVVASSLSLGGGHACAILSNGRVKCWGANAYGQLGAGDVLSRGDAPNEMGESLPYVDLGAGASAASISLGLDHACALVSSGYVLCWGRNNVGQLGYGDTWTRGDFPGEMGSNLPAVSMGSVWAATSISCGSFFSCAVAGGVVKCWGQNNFGQLGAGISALSVGDEVNEMGNQLIPVNLGAGVMASAVFAGSFHACAITTSLQVKCWGQNSNGQLGYEDQFVRGFSSDDMGSNLPFVNLGEGFVPASMCLGYAHTCVLDSATKRVKCFGYNAFGQLGYGDNTDRGKDANTMGSWLPFVNVQGVQQVSCGPHHTCVLLQNDATVRCWGYSSLGNLGYGDMDPLNDASLAPPVDLGRIAVCPNCTAGQFMPAGQCVCQACPAGTYSATNGSTECTPCPRGTYSNATNASSSSACNPCPAGTFSNLAGASSNATCVLCGAGYYSATNASTGCSACARGSFSAGAGGASSCQLCPRGSFASQDAATSCNLCYQVFFHVFDLESKPASHTNFCRVPTPSSRVPRRLIRA